jgi:hypothetical protein
MKVTNSDLVLLIGPTARNMKGSDIRNGCPVAIPYWMEIDTDLVSELAPLTDTGGGRLARGVGQNFVSVEDEDTGEKISGDVFSVATISEEESHKELSDARNLMQMLETTTALNVETFGMSAVSEEEGHKGLLEAKDLKQDLEVDKLEQELAKAQGLTVEKLEQELELEKLTSSQKRDDEHVDRNAIKKPAGSQWDGEKGANALIDAQETVLDNPKLIARLDALQDAIDAEEQLAKSGSGLERAKAIKIKHELESKLNEFGATNEKVFRGWKKWRNTSEEKKEQTFLNLGVSEFFSVVQRANETGDVGTCEDPLKYDHSQQERYDVRSDHLNESSVLEDKSDKKFAGSMLHGRKSIQIQMHQAQGVNATYEDMAKAQHRAKEANQAVHGWRK